MLWALPFFVLTGLLLPVMALATLRHQRKSEAGAEEGVSTGSLALQALAVQSLLLLLAWLAARGTGAEVSWRSLVTPITLLATVAIIVGGLAFAAVEARSKSAKDDALRRRLRQISPLHPAWLTVSAVAAVSEEFAYRGVLTLLLTSSLGLPLAALASAALFGLGHLAQGVRGAVGGALFGLLLQGLIHLSGGLLLAVVAHFAYDLGVAWLGSRATKPRPLEHS